MELLWLKSEDELLTMNYHNYDYDIASDLLNVVTDLTWKITVASIWNFLFIQNDRLNKNNE